LPRDEESKGSGTTSVWVTVRKDRGVKHQKCVDLMKSSRPCQFSSTKKPDGRRGKVRSDAGGTKKKKKKKKKTTKSRRNWKG